MQAAPAPCSLRFTPFYSVLLRYSQVKALEGVSSDTPFWGVDPQLLCHTPFYSVFGPRFSPKISLERE